MEYAFFRVVLGLFSILPFSLRRILALGILKVAGWIKLNRLAMQNLDHAYGDQISSDEKRAILKRLQGNLARMAAELSIFYKRKRQFVQENVDADPSLQRLYEGLKPGQGLIVVTPHFGNWEIIPTWGAENNFHGAVVGKMLKNERLNNFILSMRTEGEMELIYQHENPRKLLRVLRDNGVVGILPDADTTRLDGIFIPYFGRTTYTPTSPASLAILAQAPILPVYVVYENRRYRFFADDLILPQTQERTPEEMRRLTQAWSDSFEKIIRKYPDQWIWFQRRWVTTPESLERKRQKTLLAE